MTQWLHAAVALLATATISTFLVSTLLVELFGSPESLVRVKALIVTPGLLVLVPALVATAASGVYLSRTRRGMLREAKIKRMPFIAANGLLVLVPCALFLNRWAAAGNFDVTFYTLQLLEIIAGAVNLVLMGLNIRDGMRMTAAGKTRAESAGAVGRDSA
ncbi:MAG: hypothetical protein OQL28_09480 [Sedimenticola sp.]|nr:hypothetical protein [Sedimenticola sp.]